MYYIINIDIKSNSVCYLQVIHKVIYYLFYSYLIMSSGRSSLKMTFGVVS